MTFLEILGLVFLVFLVVLAYYGWKIYRFFRRNLSLNSPFQQVVSVLPKFQLYLEDVELADWSLANRRPQDFAALKKLAAVHVGDFAQYLENQSIYISLWCYNERVAIVCYEACPLHAPDMPTHYMSEVYVQLADGGSICVSNSPFANTLPRPDEHPIYTTSEVEIPRLLAELKAKLPAEKRLSKMSDVKHTFMNVYEELTEWQWQEEQLRSEQLQAMFAPLKIKFDEELIQQLLSHVKSELEHVYSEKVIRRLAKSTKMSAEQWDDFRDRLVVVHTKMSLSSVSDLLLSYAQGLSESDEDKLSAVGERESDSDPLACFSFYAGKFGKNLRLKRIAEMKEPVEAHVYLELARQ